MLAIALCLATVVVFAVSWNRPSRSAARMVNVLPIMDVEHFEAINALWADIEAMPDGPDRDTLERCIRPPRPLVGGSPKPPQTPPHAGTSATTTWARTPPPAPVPPPGYERVPGTFSTVRRAPVENDHRNTRRTT